MLYLSLQLHLFLTFCSTGESYKLNTVLWNTVKLMFPREVEGRKTMHALDRPKDLSAQFCDSLEFLVKWDKCMYLALAGISASTIAVHIWAMFTMNR